MRRQLVVECPRMKCEEKNAFGKDLGVLGTSLQKVFMSTIGEVDVDDLAMEIRACSAIEEIELHASDDDAAADVTAML